MIDLHPYREKKMSEPLNSGGAGDLTVDQIYDELNVDDEPEIIPLEDDKKEKDEDEPIKKGKETKEKEEVEGEGEEDEEPDEIEELAEELEEPSADKLQLMTPVRRAEILKEYPDLFKKFPYLEVAYYREQQFTQIHPTIEDAKLSAEKSETLDRFEKDLKSGDSTNVLQAVKEEDENAFLNLVDNYLPNLAKVDQGAFQHVIGTVVKNTIYSMVQEARASDNKALESAATILNQFVFGSSKFEAPKKLFDSTKAKTEDTKVSEERQQYYQERFEQARTDVGNRIVSLLKATIDANIDPKKSMTDYVKRNASRDALERAQNSIRGDQRFTLILDKLWQAVFKNGFKQEDVKRVEAAYRSKARVLLPTAIKQARSEALRGTSRRVKEDESLDDEKEETPARRKRDSGPSNRTRQDDGQDKMRGKSTLDILNED